MSKNEVRKKERKRKENKGKGKYELTCSHICGGKWDLMIILNYCTRVTVVNVQSCVDISRDMYSSGGRNWGFSSTSWLQLVGCV